jgi:hypothetical protein
MAEHVELERATQEELRTDLRALFQGAIRLVIETALQEEVRELARADPFDYLLQLLGHRAAVAAAPSEWMPWNYRETLAGRVTRAP